MTVFFDDFQRANGPLGANWQDTYSTSSISGGYAIGNSDTYTYCTVVTDTDYQEVEASVGWVTNNTTNAGPMVKAGTSGRFGYWCTIGYSGGVATWYLYKRGSGGVAILASEVLVGLPPYMSTQRIVWDNGTITATLNGGHTLTSNDSELLLNDHMGMRLPNANAVIADIRITGQTVSGLSADPSIIGNYGQCTEVILTGTGTNWTPGTPGSPTFTTDHGHIESQEVISATEAHIVLCPDDYLGAISVCDPSTGQCVSITATSNPGIVPPEGALSATAIEYIERSAISGPDPTTILNQDIQLPVIEIPSGPREALGWLYRSLANLVDPETPPVSGSNWTNDIYARIWGGEEWEQVSFAPAGTNSLMDWLSQVYTIVNTMSQSNTLTLQSVLDAIAGISGGDIQPILDLIGAPAEGEPSTLFLFIASVLAGTPNSLSQVIAKLDALRTAENLNLDQIVGEEVTEGWIPPYTTKGLWDYLHNLRGNEAADVGQAQAYAQTAAEQATAAENDLNAIRTAQQYTIQSILDAIDGIPPADIQPILDWLEAIQNGNAPSLKSIMDSLTAYRTGNNYTVQSILDAIGVDSDNPNYTVPALLALLAAALAGDVALVAALIAKLATGKLDLVVDIIDAIASLGNFLHNLFDHVDPSSTGYVRTSAPVYPGLEGVTLLDPVPFENGVNIALRMDGALIDISTPGEHPYAIKNTQPTRYGRLGTFAFACDVERLEAIQPIQYLNFVATPKGIANPTGIVVQCKQGTVGTVIPYLLA